MAQYQPKPDPTTGALPDIADISAHLYLLFSPAFVRPYPDAWIEIAYAKPDGKLNEAKNFSAFDLKEAAEFAAAKNAAGYNIYAAPALRHGKRPHSGRASADHFLTSAFAWAEYDGADDDQRIQTILKDKQLSPALVVTTGTVPHRRAHLYFRLADGVTDAEQLKKINTSLRDLFKSDDVQDPCRVLRLTGTVNYPTTKKKERGYVTELVTLHQTDARAYPPAALIGLAPTTGNPFQDFGNRILAGVGGRSGDELLALLERSRIPHQWHNSIRDAVASMVGQGWPDDAIKLSCASYCKEGADDPDLAELIDGARSKFSIPNSKQADEETTTDFLCLTLDQWRGRDLPMPDFLLGEVFHTTSRAIMSAPTGLGKTNFALAIGMRMAAGMNFLHWQGRRVSKVFYIDGEMSRRLLRQRLAAEEARLQYSPAGFHALNTEDIPNFQPLNKRQGQAAIEKIIAEVGGCDFVILDNVMSLISGSMADEEAWANTVPWAKSLTKRGIGQLWVHHTGHDETRGYGTKTREWQMDTVMHLTAVQRADTDVSFELEFKKARERRPDNRSDFTTLNAFLMDDQWVCDAPAGTVGRKASPMAMKYLDALANVVGGGETPRSKRLHGRHAVHNDDWKAECELLGLLDPKGKANAERAKFYKNRTELVVADKVACEGAHTWIR